jgi:hypothetical protein
MKGQTMKKTTAAPKAVSAPPLSAPVSDATPPPVAADRLHAQIAQRAYLRAEQRGFAPGFGIDDWLAAEAEIRSDASAAQPAGAAKRRASQRSITRADQHPPQDTPTDQPQPA